MKDFTRSALMVEETALRTALAEKKLVLAIGLLSERPVFAAKKASPI